MSESVANPRILVNGEAEKQSPSVSLDEESSAETETPPKMQSVLQRVRRRIRSQGRMQASQISILELMQTLKDNEVKTAQVNGERREQQEGAAAVADGQRVSVSPDEEGSEGSAAAQSLTPKSKMQSTLQQVRSQIRSEAGVQVPQGGVRELVHKIREVIALAEGEEKKQAEVLRDESSIDLEREELCAIFEEKLEASEKALRDEFGRKVSQVRAEMQAYTDQALKDLESKMQSCNNRAQPHPKERHEGSDMRPKPKAPPSLAARRGRVLTRTMTLVPKMGSPVVTGQGDKSETLSSSKGEGSKLLLRDPTVTVIVPHGKRCKRCKSLLPPCSPPTAAGQKNRRGQS